MVFALFKLITKKKKQPKVMALPPTTANLLQHILFAYLQAMLWKAADFQGPSDESRDITNLRWKFQIKFLYRSLLNVISIHLNYLM